MAKKILMATANHWNSPFKVGSHEIAKAFIHDGWDVLYLSDPISPFHKLKSKNELIADRIEINKSGGKKYFDDKLISYVPYSLFTPYPLPFFNSKFTYKNWNKYSLPNISRKIKEFGFDKVDVLYFDSIYQSFLVNSINFRKSVFRLADNNSGFTRYGKNSMSVEKLLAGKVDLVLYTARNLKEYVNNLSPQKAAYFPNGVNFDNFNKGSKSLPDEFNSIPSPRILYVGAIHEWFDFDLVEKTAKEYPNYSFVLIGNKESAAARFSHLKNVYLLGIKKYTELSKYIYNSDVGIIPFNKLKYPDLVNSINPLKLYQYFACGLPVVSVSWNEIEMLNSPAKLYSNPNHFGTLLKQTIETEKNPEFLMEYAKQFDWKNKFQNLKSLLEI
ncbi:MAG: glycosyltransferase [Ignavibacteriae bacterium]|nr:glycosyltransferase [Ignavibacteriota bacterium]NOG96942.1 glycosyltransferase [Ignavibacteriota bacterium]